MAVTGPAMLPAGRPGGVSLTSFSVMGMTVTAISMMTVPPTVGVMILRRRPR